MAAVSTNDLKNGMTLDLPEGLFQVVEFQHVKPGKGGAFVRTTLRNIRTGAASTAPSGPTRSSSRRSSTSATCSSCTATAATSSSWTTRPTSSSPCPPTSLGDAASYIIDGSTVTLMMFGDEIVGSDLPAAVELNVTETEPGVQGDRVSGARKPATLETGLTLQVPLFVNPGDRIKVDTRSGEYITRA